MIKCHKCGSNMVWQNDYDVEEMYAFDVDSKGIVSIWKCPTCPSMTYEIIEIFEGEDE